MSAGEKGETSASPRWLLLVHQLPARPTNVRVKTWRRLQDVGAVAVKNSVYVLPNLRQAREDLEWIKEEITSMQGQATLFAADHVDAFTEDELVGAFQRAREQDYAALRGEADRLRKSVKRGKLTRTARARLERAVDALRERWTETSQRDFFGAPGREEVAAALDEIETDIAGAGAGPGFAGGEPLAAGTLRPEDFRGRVWVTRARPGIDRMGSAWLIRRFIDPQAQFGFAERLDAPAGVVPFDMYGVELGHQGNLCTMETMVQRFGIKDSAVDALCRIVHQLDLKDSLYSTPEAPAMDKLVRGLRLLYAEDRDLLERGRVLFEALYRSFDDERLEAAPAATTMKVRTRRDVARSATRKKK